MKESNSKTFLAIASCIGSLMEMYDFVIYGFFATYIAVLFFPKSDHSANLIATFAIFAIGYFMRPVGGIVIGNLTDRLGRKKGLLISVMCMGIPMFLIGLLPTHHSIGLWAPVLLLILRILQGFSVGGELPSAITFLAEHAPTKKRGIFSSWVFFGVNAGVLVALAVSFVITKTLSHHQILNWGWRLPFLFGGLLALISYLVRRKLLETPVFTELQQNNKVVKHPIKTCFTKAPAHLIKGILLIAVMASAVSAVFLYLPTYLTHYLHVTLATALGFNAINMFVFIFCLLLFAKISDHIGRKKVLMTGTLVFIIFSIPIFSLLSQPDLLLPAMILLGIITALIIGPAPIALVEMYQSSLRTTSIGIAYNFSFAIFGGLAPMIITAWIAASNNVLAPAYLMIITGVISLITLLTIKDGFKNSLT